MKEADDFQLIGAGLPLGSQKRFPVYLIIPTAIALGDVWGLDGIADDDVRAVSTTDEDAATFLREVMLSKCD